MPSSQTQTAIQTAEQPALYTFTYRAPGAVNTTTLDCFAATRDAALRSARRFIARENRRLRAAGFTQRIRTPQMHTLVNETARWAARAAQVSA